MLVISQLLKGLWSVNQLKDWDGKCQRCYIPSDTHTMSMFDVSLICMKCKEAERKHPRYEAALAAEEYAVKRGDRNFEGMGYPEGEVANDPIDW